MGFMWLRIVTVLFCGAASISAQCIPTLNPFTGLMDCAGSAGGGGGSGTVTSVALTLPAIFGVTGSPVTTSGTLAATLANQTANLIFAGPSSGGAAAPTFRALAGADLPNPGASAKGGVQSITCSGTDKISEIGTNGVPVCTADQNSGGATFATIAGGTNTAAAMVIGSGASFAPAGTGSVKATELVDSNINSVIVSAAVASLVNRFTFQGSATGNAPQIAATGSDTNIDFSLLSKGSGFIRIPHDAFGAPAPNATFGNYTGLRLVNSTAAISGTQQVSPALVFEGQGFKTDATTASQSVRYHAFVLPTQQAGNPAGFMMFAPQINNGAMDTTQLTTSPGWFYSTCSTTVPCFGIGRVGWNGAAPTTGFGFAASGTINWISSSVNEILFAPGGLEAKSAGLYGWSSGDPGNAFNPDTAMGRASAGVIDLNKGGSTCTAGSANCSSVVVGGITAKGIVDATAATSTAPVKSGTAPPGTCNVGEMFYDTDATTNSRLLTCDVANTWVVVGPAAGSSADPNCVPTKTSGTVTTVATSCRAALGHKNQSLAGNATVTLTGTPSGELFLYWTSSGLVAGVASTTNVACNAQCSLASGITAFPNDSIPIASIPYTSGTYGTLVDARGTLSRQLIEGAADGSISITDGANGAKIIQGKNKSAQYYPAGGAAGNMAAYGGSGYNFYQTNANTLSWIAGGVIPPVYRLDATGATGPVAKLVIDLSDTWDGNPIALKISTIAVSTAGAVRLEAGGICVASDTGAYDAVPSTFSGITLTHTTSGISTPRQITGTIASIPLSGCSALTANQKLVIGFRRMDGDAADTEPDHAYIAGMTPIYFH